MKRIVTCCLLVFSVLVVYGAQCDSIKVFFPLNKAAFDTTLNNDAAAMARFIDGIRMSLKSGDIDHIVVYGYASPEGSFLNNERLAVRRCDVVADYISRHTAVPREDIQASSGGVAWVGLRDLVKEDPRTPSREAVLRILDEYIPAACTDRTISDQCMRKLVKIDFGHTYRWLLDNLFPKLRFSLAIYTAESPKCIIDTVIFDNIEIAPPSVYINEEIALGVPSFIERGSSISVPPLHRLALKTNLLYDAALFPNLEVEWRVNNKWSLALEGGIAWWGKHSRQKVYQLVMFSPEVRRWFYTRAPWHGLYAGAFVGGGYYDFQNGTPGRRGEGYMGGLSVGYMWPIGRNLSLEAEIGAGYLYTRYKEYKPVDDHLVYQRTKALNYFGPLKLKFSLVWRLWDVSNPVRLNFLKRFDEAS